LYNEEVEIEQAGRPRKIGQVDLDLLCQLLEEGATIPIACARVGISERTYYRWRLLGLQEEDEVFVNFLMRVDLARSKFQRDLLECVYEESRHNPKVAMWLLERLYPQEFSLNPHFRKDKFDIKQEEFKEGPVRFSITYGDTPRMQSAEKEREMDEFLNVMLYSQDNNLDITEVEYDKLKQEYYKWIEERE